MSYQAAGTEFNPAPAYEITASGNRFLPNGGSRSWASSPSSAANVDSGAAIVGRGSLLAQEHEAQVRRKSPVRMVPKATRGTLVASMEPLEKPEAVRGGSGGGRFADFYSTTTSTTHSRGKEQLRAGDRNDHHETTNDSVKPLDTSLPAASEMVPIASAATKNVASHNVEEAERGRSAQQQQPEQETTRVRQPDDDIIDGGIASEDSDEEEGLEEQQVRAAVDSAAGNGRKTGENLLPAGRHPNTAPYRSPFKVGTNSKMMMGELESPTTPNHPYGDFRQAVRVPQQQEQQQQQAPQYQHHSSSPMGQRMQADRSQSGGTVLAFSPSAAAAAGAHHQQQQHNPGTKSPERGQSAGPLHQRTPSAAGSVATASASPQPVESTTSGLSSTRKSMEVLSGGGNHHPHHHLNNSVFDPIRYATEQQHQRQQQNNNTDRSISAISNSSSQYHQQQQHHDRDLDVITEVRSQLNADAASRGGGGGAGGSPSSTSYTHQLIGRELELLRNRLVSLKAENEKLKSELMKKDARFEKNEALVQQKDKLIQDLQSHIKVERDEKESALDEVKSLQVELEAMKRRVVDLERHRNPLHASTNSSSQMLDRSSSRSAASLLLSSRNHSTTAGTGLTTPPRQNIAAGGGGRNSPSRVQNDKSEEKHGEGPDQELQQPPLPPSSSPPKSSIQPLNASGVSVNHPLLVDRSVVGDDNTTTAAAEEGSPPLTAKNKEGSNQQEGNDDQLSPPTADPVVHNNTSFSSPQATRFSAATYARLNSLGQGLPPQFLPLFQPLRSHSVGSSTSAAQHGSGSVVGNDHNSNSHHLTSRDPLLAHHLHHQLDLLGTAAAISAGHPSATAAAGSRYPSRALQEYVVTLERNLIRLEKEREKKEDAEPSSLQSTPPKLKSKQTPEKSHSTPPQGEVTSQPNRVTEAVSSSNKEDLAQVTQVLQLLVEEMKTLKEESSAVAQQQRSKSSPAQIIYASSPAPPAAPPPASAIILSPPAQQPQEAVAAAAGLASPPSNQRLITATSLSPMTDANATPGGGLARGGAVSEKNNDYNIPTAGTPVRDSSLTVATSGGRGSAIKESLSSRLAAPGITSATTTASSLQSSYGGVIPSMSSGAGTLEQQQQQPPSALAAQPVEFEEVVEDEEGSVPPPPDVAPPASAIAAAPATQVGSALVASAVASGVAQHAHHPAAQSMARVTAELQAKLGGKRNELAGGTGVNNDGAENYEIVGGPALAVLHPKEIVQAPSPPRLRSSSYGPQSTPEMIVRSDPASELADSPPNRNPEHPQYEDQLAAQHAAAAEKKRNHRSSSSKATRETSAGKSAEEKKRRKRSSSTGDRSHKKTVNEDQRGSKQRKVLSSRISEVPSGMVPVAAAATGDMSPESRPKSSPSRNSPTSYAKIPTTSSPNGGGSGTGTPRLRSPDLVQTPPGLVPGGVGSSQVQQHPPPPPPGDINNRVSPTATASMTRPENVASVAANLMSNAAAGVNGNNKPRFNVMRPAPLVTAANQGAPPPPPPGTRHHDPATLQQQATGSIPAAQQQPYYPDPTPTPTASNKPRGPLAFTAPPVAASSTTATIQQQGPLPATGQSRVTAAPPRNRPLQQVSGNTPPAVVVSPPSNKLQQQTQEMSSPPLQHTVVAPAPTGPLNDNTVSVDGDEKAAIKIQVKGLKNRAWKKGPKS